MKSAGIVKNCEVCGIEVKLTPRRALKNKHHTCSKKCMGKLSSQLQSKKVTTECKSCGEAMSLKRSNIVKIKNPTCSARCAREIRSLNYHGKSNPNYKGESNLEKLLSRRLTGCLERATSKELPFDLDLPYLTNLFERQAGLCAYSRVQMKIDGPISFDTLSIDRVVPKDGYVKGNVVFCLNSINRLKSDHSLDEMMIVFGALALNYKPVPIHFIEVDQF